jgi:FAD-dependent urate hydroxylase
MRVIIIGAGLAGPSMALALAKQGIKSTIYERKEKAEDIGGIIMLASNSMRSLDKVVGIEKEVRALGYSFTGLALYAGGHGDMDHLGDVKFDVGATSLTIKRPLFHELLLRLCEENELVDVKFGKSLKGIEEDEERVVALFEDGTSAEGECSDILYFPLPQSFPLST